MLHVCVCGCVCVFAGTALAVWVVMHLTQWLVTVIISPVSMNHLCNLIELQMSYGLVKCLVQSLNKKPWQSVCSFWNYWKVHLSHRQATLAQWQSVCSFLNQWKVYLSHQQETLAVSIPLPDFFNQWKAWSLHMHTYIQSHPIWGQGPRPCKGSETTVSVC